MRHSNRRPFPDPFGFLPKGLTKLFSIWVSLTYPFASKGRNMSFHFTSQMDRQRASRISLGNSVTLKKDAWLNVATEDPTGEPVIVLDDNCHIGHGSIISAKNQIHLERDVLVAQQVIMLDHNHTYEDSRCRSSIRVLLGMARSELAKDLGSGVGRPSYAHEGS